VDSFAKALSAAASAPYQPHPQGMLWAREAVASYYAERGIAADPASLILTSGTSEGYSHLFTLLADPGDEILVPTPGYPLLEVLTGLGAVQLVHYRQVYDEVRGWRIDLERLRASVSDRTRAIVAVNPNNPTGAFLKHKELDEIGAICREHDLALIVDEVFSDYGTGSDEHRVSSAAGFEGALTFVLNGLSKMSGLPQMKLAWILASGPADLQGQAVDRLAFIADAYLSVGTPVQHAAPVLLAARNSVAAQVRARVDSNHAVAAALSGERCRVLKREGGWYAVLRLPDDMHDEDVAVSLLEKDGVLVHPGYFYDFPPGGTFLVLSLLPPEPVFTDGVRRIVSRLRS
jgi:hypothetical protein